MGTEFNVLNQFELISVGRMNYDKTKISGLGPLKNIKTKLYTQKLASSTSDPNRILEIDVSNNNKGIKIQ